MEQIKIYHAKNEPVLSYMKGSKERLNVEEAYNRMFNSRVEIPLYIGSERIITNERKLKIFKENLSNSKSLVWNISKEIQKVKGIQKQILSQCVVEQERQSSKNMERNKSYPNRRLQKSGGHTKKQWLNKNKAFPSCYLFVGKSSAIGVSPAHRQAKNR